MARSSGSTTKRPRISVDVEPALRHRLRLAAAKRDVTVQRYVLHAIEERLNEDLGDETEAMIALTAKADPVLAELWDNPRDAECHRHSREIPGGRAADVGSA